MIISYKWLKDYVDVNLDPEKLAELFTLSGLSVAGVKKRADDSIIEIEVTSNRPDWLSYIGVARELAAITGSKLKIPPSSAFHPAAPGPRLPVKIEDQNLCPRYTARVIKNVKVGPSPAWLASKIEAMGLRPVNNIVDITNFCLFETGEPMHAFDLDKLKGPEITVRRAKKGEMINLIDGSEKALDETNLVIADAERAVAIAGVMGGADTEVTSSTKNILLEAAAFDPVSIRRTARKLALSSESSYRFERKVDIDNIAYSSDRAAALILELAQGQAGELVDAGEKAPAKRTARLRYSRMNRIIDLDISAKDASAILNALGLKTVSSSQDSAEFEIPRLRGDLENEIDLVEEIARIYGYDRVPAGIPAIFEQPVRRPFEDIVESKARAALTAMGLNEILTYSLLSGKFIKAEGLYGQSTVEVANPLSSEQEAMRPSLLAGLLNSMSWNMNRRAKDLKLFEIGSVYIKEGDDIFTEKLSLSVGMAGAASPGIPGASRSCGFFDVKGVIEVLLEELGVKGYVFKDSSDNRFAPEARASIEIDGKTVAVLGEVNRKLLTDLDIKERVYAGLLDLGAIMGYVYLEKHFKELPRYPSITRDISIIAGKEASNALVIETIKSVAGPVLADVKLIDMYMGKQIPEGKTSLTYRLEYQDPARTLEDKDITDAHTRIIKALESKLRAKQR